MAVIVADERLWLFCTDSAALGDKWRFGPTRLQGSELTGSGVTLFLFPTENRITESDWRRVYGISGGLSTGKSAILILTSM